MLPKIPQDFPSILIKQFNDFINNLLQDFVHKEIPRLAAEKEAYLNKQLSKAQVGDSFCDQPVIATSSDTITVLCRFADIDVPGISGLKLRLARGAIEMERWVNLTSSARPLLHVRSVPAYAIEIVQTADSHEIAIGGGVDHLAGFNQFKVGVRWKSPEIIFRGFLAQRDKGGFLIDVHAASQFAIPVGPTGFGIKGAGILYGEHFAPDLRDPGEVGDVIARMERASAQDYVNWIHRNDLEKWWPVDQHLRIYGISTSVCDMLSCGEILVIEDAGIAYIDYGPVIVFGGQLKVLKSGEIGEVTGAIDVRSQTFFGRSVVQMALIPWAPEALKFTGTNELSASLKDQDRTWWAMGGYDMDGCQVKVLDALVLWGGMRVTPLQGTAARAGGRSEGRLDFIASSGYSLAINLDGHLGWNPLALGGTLTASGDAWIKIFGQKLGVGISGTLAAQLPEPLYLRLDVEFRLSLPWGDKTFPATIFNLEKVDIHPPSPPVAIPASTPLAYIHGPSGTLGQLTQQTSQVWPDIAFDLPFQRNASGPRLITNPPPLAGFHDEAGISVTHQIDELRIVKLDEHGNEVDVPDVSACWILSRHGDNAVVTNRLAVPCNNPLDWCSRFDYAVPGSTEPVETFRFQTFGTGPVQDFPVEPASGLATLRTEWLRVTSPRALLLVPVPWAGDYGRLLSSAKLVAIEAVDPTAQPLSVKSYQLRVIGRENRFPQIPVRGGSVQGATVIQRFEGGAVEWSVSIGRQASDYRKPLIIGDPERSISIAAIGFVYDPMADVDGGTRTVLTPGNYRLHLKGKSHARKHAASSDNDWPPAVRDFEVIRPPLRPYLKFATFGDERVFGISAPGWNPNPQGSGFGHYQDHFGLIRARVSYLSKIYPKLWLSPADGMKPIGVNVQPARDGTIAGNRASQDWELVTGAAPAREEEMEVMLPRSGGSATARVYFSVAGDGSDIDLKIPLDTWSYRISEYPNPTAHLRPAVDAITWQFGPSGAHRLALPPAAPIPAGFKFADSPLARTRAGWPLPMAITQFAGLGSANASLRYLHLLEWAGTFLIAGPAEENILNRPQAPELCVVRDRAASPIGLLWRTSEPCDWRRVELSVVVGDLSADHCRFTTRLVASSDGCACLILLEADDLPMRVPSGDLALELRFALASPGLARLTDASQPDRALESFHFRVVQPFGPVWPFKE